MGDPSLLKKFNVVTRAANIVPEPYTPSPPPSPPTRTPLPARISNSSSDSVLTTLQRTVSLSSTSSTASLPVCEKRTSFVFDKLSMLPFTENRVPMAAMDDPFKYCGDCFGNDDDVA